MPLTTCIPRVIHQQEERMPELTIEAIRENPWNVVTHTLPTQPPEVLLEAAFLAAEYCRNSEYMLMHAARDGNYVPPGWQRGGCDVHEINEGRGFQAEVKLDEVCERGAKDHDWIIER
jgi:hypothetical protein